MNGFKSPWHVGVLWNDDPRLPQPRALPHCSLEVRQDLIDTPTTARAWGRRLTSAIGAAISAALR